MPIYKCDNGKYKIGHQGQCKFKSKAAAERAFLHWIESKKQCDFEVWYEELPKKERELYEKEM